MTITITLIIVAVRNPITIKSMMPIISRSLNEDDHKQEHNHSNGNITSASNSDDGDTVKAVMLISTHNKNEPIIMANTKRYRL